MSVLSSFVLFVAVLGCHASDLSQDDGWVAVTNKLQVEANKLATLVKELKNDNDARKTENEAMKMENEAIKTEVERLRNRTLVATTPACFSAVKTSTQTVVTGDTIIFDEEIIDTHDTFNPTYGIYVIPQTGIWEVIVTLYKPYSAVGALNGLTGDVYVGEMFLTRIYIQTNGGSNYYWDTDSSTWTIIRQFNVGDPLKVMAGANKECYGSTDYKASQFSAKFLGE